MNKKLIIFAGIGFLSLSLLVLPGCKKSDKKVLAKVGKSSITEEQFYSLIPPEYATSLTSDQKQELLKMWVNTELLYNQALKTKLNKESSVKLKLTTLERQLLANEYLERYLSKVSSVSDADIKKYFDSRKNYYNTEREIAQIVVRDEMLANKIITEVKSGSDFSKLAKQYSIDSVSALNGGVMGYVRLGDLAIPELEEALFSIKEVGSVSSPIRTMFGYHIIKLLGIRELKDSLVTYDSMKERIRNSLNLPKRNAALDSLLADLRKKHKTVENYDLLK